MILFIVCTTLQSKSLRNVFQVAAKSLLYEHHFWNLLGAPYGGKLLIKWYLPCACRIKCRYRWEGRSLAWAGSSTIACSSTQPIANRFLSKQNIILCVSRVSALLYAFIQINNGCLNHAAYMDMPHITTSSHVFFYYHLLCASKRIVIVSMLFLELFIVFCTRKKTTQKIIR